MKRFVILSWILLVAASAFAGGRDEGDSHLIRSLRFENLEIRNVFAALQSFYASNPIGSIEIRNVDAIEVTDVSVLFDQPHWMDAPTLCAEIEKIDGGESATVPLRAVFAATVFETEGPTPLMGEVIVTYRSNGRPAEQRYSVQYTLFDRTMMIWDDDRRLGSFITYQDKVVRDYANWILRSCANDTGSSLSTNLQNAMQIYAALGEFGCSYRNDPSDMYTDDNSGDLTPINSVSLPRDTLRTQSGDFDDLTVLYCAMLESVSVETAIVLIGDRVYPAFNPELETASERDLAISRGMVLQTDDRLWIPVDISLVGDEGFATAWNNAIETWRADDKSDRRMLIPTRDAQSMYGPIALRAVDPGLQYGDPELVAAAFRKQVSDLVSLIQ